MHLSLDPSAFPAAQPACHMRLDLSPFKIPSSEYSQCPFWFWNDALEEKEIVRQMADFRDHGVEAFVIHPRLGLPKTSGWLSEELFGFMRIALEEARKHGMWVMLYDEGMYPSGSSAGQVVASDARFHARGLVCERVGEQEEGGQLDRRILRKIKRRGGGELYVIDQRSILSSAASIIMMRARARNWSMLLRTCSIPKR